MNCFPQLRTESLALKIRKPVRKLLAFARMPRVEARGGMATGDRGVAHRAKTGGFGGVPLGFATDAPRGSAGSFTFPSPGGLNLPRRGGEKLRAVG